MNPFTSDGPGTADLLPARTYVAGGLNGERPENSPVV